MKIQEKPKKEVKLERYIGKLASAVRILEEKGRVVVPIVPAQFYPTFGLDESTVEGILVKSLISKGYTYFSKSVVIDGPSGYTTHYSYVFFGPQVKEFAKTDTILSMFNSNKIIVLESELEYKFLVDVVSYHHTAYNETIKTLENESELNFPLAVELISKEGYNSTEFIIQLAK